MPAIDVEEYRSRYEQQLGRAGATATRGARDHTAIDVEAVATDADVGGMTDDELAARVALLLEVAQDRSRKVAERVDALQALSSLEFLGARFSPHRSAWLAALRTLAEDPRATVRKRALEQLALRQDPRARELLLAGLDRPDRALVPEVVALQYLGQDGHGDALPAARKVYRRASGPAREEALRILATDPGSAGMLDRLMRDKSETSSVRRISATALADLDPERFEKAARRVVADDEDFNEIRSTSLTGLTMSRAPDEEPDDALVQTVAALRASSRSRAVKASADRFLDAAGEP